MLKSDSRKSGRSCATLTGSAPFGLKYWNWKRDEVRSVRV